MANNKTKEVKVNRPTPKKTKRVMDPVILVKTGDTIKAQPAPKRVVAQRTSLQKKLSKESQDFIVQALDPYHDYRRNRVGYPDMSSGSSAVVRIVERLTIKRPNNVAENATWQFHMFNTPVQTMSAAAQSERGTLTVTGTVNAGPGRTLKQQFIQIWSGSMSDEEMVFGENSNAESTGTGFQETLQQQRGGARLVAAGFEIVNTTPNLTKGGTATHYRVPWMHDRGIVVDYDPDTQKKHTRTVYQYSGAPNTISEAQNSPGSQTWNAEFGSYCVCTQSAMDNALTMPMFHEPIMFETPPNLTSNVRAIFNAGLANETNNPTVYHLNNMDCSGAWYTGLSPDSTFTVTVCMYIEMIPDPSNKLLVSMSNPMAAYDPDALELLARCYTQLPVACPKGDNDAGDFFRKVLGIIGKVGTGLGTALAFVPGLQEFAPLAGAIGMGAEGIAHRIPTRIKGDGRPQ